MSFLPFWYADSSFPASTKMVAVQIHCHSPRLRVGHEKVIIRFFVIHKTAVKREACYYKIVIYH